MDDDEAPTSSPDASHLGIALAPVMATVALLTLTEQYSELPGALAALGATAVILRL